MKEKSLIEKLAWIQQNVSVPKSLWNDFSKYHYRSAESILDAVKPICFEARSTLVLHDELIEVGGSVYVKAVAQLIDWDSENKLYGVAYAREPESKKGMDASQITGSTSSYARKYALNGLFNLDDVKDADTMDNTGEATVKATEKQLEFIKNLYSNDELEIMLARMEKKLQDLTVDEASKMIEHKRGK